MKPGRKRKLAFEMSADYSISQRRTCRLIMLNRSTFLYKPHPPDERPLRMRLRELAFARPRYGYRRLTILLQREGWCVNHKRIHRIYKDEGLMVRTKRRRKHAAKSRLKPLPAMRPAEHWSVDFVADQLADGRRFRIFTAIDHFSRECVCAKVGQNLNAQAVTEALDQAISRYGHQKSSFWTMAQNSPASTSTAGRIIGASGWTLSRQVVRSRTPTLRVSTANCGMSA